MGVFESKIKDSGDLAKAFGTLPTGISVEKAEEIWKKYDENGDGTLDMSEAKHMVTDLAELTVQWAKSNISTIMEEATIDGDQEDPEKRVAEHQKTIDAAYVLIKDESVIDRIVKDFDTDGDGQVSKEEFLAKATEGYSILRSAKKAKTEEPISAAQLVEVKEVLKKLSAQLPQSSNQDLIKAAMELQRIAGSAK